MTEDNLTAKTKIIHSNKVAGYLLMSGCKLISIKPNLKNPLFNVYIFINNEKLQKNLSEYMQWSKDVVFLNKQHLINQFNNKTEESKI